MKAWRSRIGSPLVIGETLQRREGGRSQLRKKPAVTAQAIVKDGDRRASSALRRATRVEEDERIVIARSASRRYVSPWVRRVRPDARGAPTRSTRSQTGTGVERLAAELGFQSPISRTRSAPYRRQSQRSRPRRVEPRGKSGQARAF